MDDSSSSDTARERLRDQIRKKRGQRTGRAEEPAAENPLADFAANQDPEMKERLSRRVAEELGKVFGTDPASLAAAKPFIDDPLSALLNETPEISEKCQKMMEELEKVCADTGDDEESPPPV